MWCLLLLTTRTHRHRFEEDTQNNRADSLAAAHGFFVDICWIPRLLLHSSWNAGVGSDRRKSAAVVGSGSRRRMYIQISRSVPDNNAVDVTNYRQLVLTKTDHAAAAGWRLWQIAQLTANCFNDGCTCVQQQRLAAARLVASATPRSD